MYLYRIHHFVDAGQSGGYSWAASLREAEREAAQWRRSHPEEQVSSIELIEFESTRKGVLTLLQAVATHPDNG